MRPSWFGRNGFAVFRRAATDMVGNIPLADHSWRESPMPGELWVERDRERGTLVRADRSRLPWEGILSTLLAIPAMGRLLEAEGVSSEEVTVGKLFSYVSWGLNNIPLPPHLDPPHEGPAAASWPNPHHVLTVGIALSDFPTSFSGGCLEERIAPKFRSSSQTALSPHKTCLLPNTRASDGRQPPEYQKIRSTIPLMLSGPQMLPRSMET